MSLHDDDLKNSDTFTDSPSIEPEGQPSPQLQDDQRTSKPKSNGKNPHRFNLINFDQLQRRTTSSYLIKGLIPVTGLVVIWGAPKSGKSFLVFDAMLHVALGWEYRDRRVTAGEVVYLALEGQDGFGDRAAAFRRHYFEDERRSVPSFFLIKERTDLVRDHVDLISCIKAQCKSPKAVVIDTMNRSLVGSESSDQDMAAYIRAGDAIRQAFNCAVIVIHHCGLDGNRPRGHTSLTGAADVQISVKRNGSDHILAKLECAKDMPQGAVIASMLEVIELGLDQDGDQITSCVVVPIENGEAKPAQVAPKVKLNDAAKIALGALDEAVVECGELIVSNDAPINGKAVSEKTWRQYAYKRGISPGGQRAKQKAFQIAIKILLESGMVKRMDDQYWLAQANTN
jgi:hypothetical protein